MNHLDDIFDTQVPQGHDYRAEKPFDKDAWAQKKQAERAEVYELIDRTAEEVGADGSALQTYLDVQSRFDRYSVGNALLIMAQKPDATRLGDFETWKNQGGYVKKDEKGIVILEPGDEYTREDGSVGVSCNPKRVFDISQTTAKAKAQPATSLDDRILIKALISDAPVRIQTTEETGVSGKGALLEPQQGTIHVQKGLAAGEMFRSIVGELAHAEFANGNPTYDRSENAFKTYCVSYILCKRNGIDTKDYDFARLPGSLSEADAQGIRGELSEIRAAANEISSRMAKALEQEKPQREQSHER